MSTSEELVASTPAPTVLAESYTFHAPLPTAPGPYILGVDEAGRGPVLGPLVYGVAYCPESYKEELDELGFADSKTLTADVRASLLDTLGSVPDKLSWSVRVLSPQAISAGMLRHPAINLNKQSQDATVLLIREVLKSGIQLSEVYVDALGNTKTYKEYLSKMFPGIAFTVENKADSKYKIVSAASVAAKVTRDNCLENWVFEEEGYTNDTPLGSGYPSDPNTKEWVAKSVEPTFGFPSIARFSWATVKNVLEKSGHTVKWNDETQADLRKAFESVKPLDQGRSLVAKDLSISTLSTL